MKTVKSNRDQFSMTHAKAARAEYCKLKDKLLLWVGLERRTVADAIESLQLKHDKLCAAYLRIPGTTYAVWLSHGPRADQDELLCAAQDPALMDRLVDRRVAQHGGVS